MVQSTTKTVEEYLRTLPGDRRLSIAKVRQVILSNLPDGYVESMDWGMICYEIPLERYPVTYNQRPLVMTGLASQKNYMSIYLMNVYTDAKTTQWFHDKYRASGKKLNMGKSCVRFKKLDDLPLEVIGETIRRCSVDEYIKRYELGIHGGKKK